MDTCARLGTLARIDSNRTVAALSLLVVLLSNMGDSMANGDDSGSVGPTAKNALAAEEKMARAIRENDADGIARSLADDWIVISGAGGIGEGKEVFPDGIRSGHLTRKTYDISEPRVRLYGNVAVITAKVKTSGTFQAKPFDVAERVTEVLVWKDGGWKVVLSHETKIENF